MYIDRYHPPKESKGYLLMFLLFATVFAWIILTYLRPTVIERGCSEIAESSSNILPIKSKDNSPYFFSNVKERCLEDSYKYSQ